MSRPLVSRLKRRANRLRYAGAFSLALIAASISAPVSAAKVYRCGNAFQDQPCPEVKIATVTPAERAPVTREAACASATRDATPRNDCTAKSGRDASREIAVETKR